MKRNFSTKFVLTLSLITMLVWVASNGCSHNSSDTPPASSAQITVSSRQIANGDVVLSYILDQTVTIQNTGSANLNVGHIAQANHLAAPFSIVSDACSGQAVQPSAACSFKVRFAPTSQGAFTDSFDIPSDASNENSVTVNVTGNGIIGQPPPPPTSSALITVSSTTIDIGNVLLNNVADQTISTQNTGSANLYIGQIAQIDPLAAPFSIVSDDCSGHAVQPSTACSFKIRFLPTIKGTFADHFDIPSNASNAPSVTVDVTGSGETLRVAINQVTSTCSTTGGVFEIITNVTDSNNLTLAGLLASNFLVKENGVPISSITVTQISYRVPISVAMVLDYTSSIQSQRPTIEAASEIFIGSLSSSDEAAIIKFAQLPQLMQGFTSDQSLLISAITTTPSQIGIDQTHLYDAAWFAVDKTATRPNHKSIVLVSDGKDGDYVGSPTGSVKTLDQVIAYAKQTNVAIYAVGLGSVDSGVMTRLANETGGQYYYITNASQLSGVYQGISDILLGQYSIKYVSTLLGSIPITLELDVTVGADTGTGISHLTGCP
jgi:VWFA-related protein